MKAFFHRDDSGALFLARTWPPKFTPRSKYYATKMTWICEEINKRKVSLLKIATTDQPGDLFSKGLFRSTFEYLRNIIMGW